VEMIEVVIALVSIIAGAIYSLYRLGIYFGQLTERINTLEKRGTGLEEYKRAIIDDILTLKDRAIQEISTAQQESEQQIHQFQKLGASVVEDIYASKNKALQKLNQVAQEITEKIQRLEELSQSADGKIVTLSTAVKEINAVTEQHLEETIDEISTLKNNAIQEISLAKQEILSSIKTDSDMMLAFKRIEDRLDEKFGINAIKAFIQVLSGCGLPELKDIELPEKLLEWAKTQLESQNKMLVVLPPSDSSLTVKALRDKQKTVENLKEQHSAGETEVGQPVDK
jgi:outer membrane murein-binding lipoprotein Lpp